tara:strand:- start:399 stop:632 length:234 start_codon:yes stop_codon:yes gene_type:complete
MRFILSIAFAKNIIRIFSKFFYGYLSALLWWAATQDIKLFQVKGLAQSSIAVPVLIYCIGDYDISSFFNECFLNYFV